jgi:nitrate/TMAO reductase-like tetraheme cytochrome c subunit
VVASVELVDVVRFVGVAVCGLGVLLCLRMARRGAGATGEANPVRLGITTMSTVTFYKLSAFLALLALPAAAVGVANYHVFEGVRDVNACARCHVMRPMVTDMLDPSSDTLAARHYRNRWIAKDQCYHCHTDYGLAGSLRAKMDGYRHLARYTTGTYHEPIVYRGTFPNGNCLGCHDGTTAFESGTSHQTIRAKLESDAVSCLNCHGRAHPTRAARTPGHPEYDRLAGGRGQ